MKKILWALFLMAPATLWAAPKIKQIDTSREKVAATKTRSTTIGSEWIVTAKDGSQCPLTVVETIGKLAILDAGNCGQMSSLRVGQKLSKNIFATHTAPRRALSSSGTGKTSLRAQKWQRIRKKLKGLSVGAIYSVAEESKVKADAGDSTLVCEPAFGVTAEYKYVDRTVIRNMGVGIIGGLSFESAREYTKVKQGGQIGTLGEKPNVTLWDFYANGVIDLTSRFSTYAGLNVAVPFANRIEGDELKPGLGYQAGASFAINDQVSIDGLYRWINLNTDSENIQNIDLNGLVIRGRYTF